MSRDRIPVGEFDFLEAMLKRGFVNIPRMLFDYLGDLGLDYDTVGRLFAIMACIGGPTESSFGAYTISRRTHPRDFDQVRGLILDLEERELVRTEDEGDQVTFSFVPLFARLRAYWQEHREHYEEEVAAGVSDPALMAAEKLMGRPLSDREAADIQDWVESYHFDPVMVQAVIREGQRQGVTRLSYLNQIARQWFEDGVQTPEEAEQSAQRFRRSAGKHRSIIQYLGLKRQLTMAEQGLLDKWSDEWEFSNEVIIRACSESNGVQNPLQYVNRILETWRDRGVRTVAEAEALVVEYKKRSSPPAAAADNGRRSRNNRSNVFLQREKKGEENYDHVFKKFDD